MIKAVLFDLDGTLLPMDQDAFTKLYLGSMAKRMAPYGFEPDKLISSIWQGSEDMVKNDGGRTNEDTFWTRFCEIHGEGARTYEPTLERYYHEDFDCAKVACRLDPMAAELVKCVKDMGLVAALATNPLFPSIATEKRAEWAGLVLADFALYTTYENSSYCKPNPMYYRYILDELGISADEAIMVGNDVDEDMIAEELGMTVFLVTDCLINRRGVDISKYPNGNLADCVNFIKSNVK